MSKPTGIVHFCSIGQRGPRYTICGIALEYWAGSLHSDDKEDVTCKSCLRVMNPKPQARKAYADKEGQRAAKLRHEIKSGTILAPDAESVIGNYKEPLTRYEDGYGYMGALTYDKTENFTQCHECGYFYKWLPMHIRYAHGLSSKKYKDKFELNYKTSLLSTNARKKFVENSTFSKWTEERWEKHRQFLKATETQRSEKLKSGNTKYRTKSLEQKNIEGKCPEQLLDKLQILANSLGRTPKSKEFAAAYGHGYAGALRFTFGTYTEACRVLNLSPHRPGMAFGSGREVYSRESLIEVLQNFKREFGREPFTSDISAAKLPSSIIFRKHFGSFVRAKIQAGVRHEPRTA